MGFLGLLRRLGRANEPQPRFVKIYIFSKTYGKFPLTSTKALPFFTISKPQFTHKSSFNSGISTKDYSEQQRQLEIPITSHSSPSLQTELLAGFQNKSRFLTHENSRFNFYILLTKL